MSGPISVTTIDGSTPLPECYDYELTLKIKVRSYERPMDPEVAIAMNRILADWDEGRRPFPVEQVEDGIDRVLANAVYQAIQKQQRAKHGTATTTVTNGNSTVAVWYLESQRLYEESRKGCDAPRRVGDSMKATIERVG